MTNLLSKLRGWLSPKGRGGGERAPRAGGGEAFDEGRGEVPEGARDSDEGPDPFDPFGGPVRIDVGDVIDLHAFAPRDVRAVVEEYLLEARRKGFRSVRIVHGKGVGVQREIVRAVLARTPFVESFADAPAGAGSWGATVAHLSPDERVSDGS